MKLKRLTLYRFALYLMLFAYMAAPTLSFKLGIPRIDNPLTVLFVLGGTLAFIYETKIMPAKIYTMLLALCAMCIWPAVHLAVSPLTQTQFMDIMFFMVLPFFCYFFYLVLTREADPLARIQKFLAVFAFYVAIPPFIELAAGMQFVSATESLSLEDGSLKGLFFNPNNLATTAVCLAPAILFFFQLQGRNRKEVLKGWGLFLLLGLAIFASVSRTAIAAYVLLCALYAVYRKNGLITVAVTGGAALLLSLIPTRMIQEFLLSLNSNPFLERFSSRVYLFLYDLGSDNSVSYRQEIYNYFWNNPPLLLAGYGPKNFRDYFGGHLSHSLGFENPHSFIIELYLGFGIISLLGLIAYVLIYSTTVLAKSSLHSKTRVIALAAMGIFLLGGFIPSTILRLPFIWLPCFLIFIYCVCLLPKHTANTAPAHTQQDLS